MEYHYWLSRGVLSRIRDALRDLVPFRQFNAKISLQKIKLIAYLFLEILESGKCYNLRAFWGILRNTQKNNYFNYRACNGKTRIKKLFI